MGLDPSAFDAAWRQYRASIYRHVLRLVRNTSDAEDLTQETFLRAHHSSATLDDPAAAGAWLYRIATHACYDFFRRLARTPASAEGASEAAAVQASDPPADTLFERVEMNECGEEFLDRLPEAYRSVLLMHDLAGLSAVEIARILHSTPGAVKIRLHRARSRFRTELESGCEFYRNERGALVGARKKPPPRRPNG